MKLFGILVFALVVVFQTTAQKGMMPDSIPVNPAVRHGRLQNGLQYYILENKNPDQLIKMSLIVDVGQEDGDIDQLGLAHLVEHLGLRSTVNFPTGVRDLLLSKNVPKSEINASTVKKNTYYYFSIPENDPDLLRVGLLALHDCAGGLSFLPNEIEEERSAVIREAAMSDGPEWSSFEETTYSRLDRKAEYKPNGPLRLKNVMEASREALINFYKDWYHPMYQTVVILGDVDGEAVERLVVKHLSDLTNTGAKIMSPATDTYDIQLSRKNRLFITIGATSYVKISKMQESKMNVSIPSTATEYKVALMDELFNEMMKRRLQVFGSGTNLESSQCIARMILDARAKIDEMQTKIAARNNDEIKSSIIFAAREMRRLERHGFSPDEYSRAKGILVASLEKRRQAVPSDLVINLIRLKEGGAFPADEQKLKLELLKTIELKEVNSMVTAWLRTEGNIDVEISTLASNMTRLPGEAEVFSWIKEGWQSKVKPYTEPIMKQLPAPPVSAIDYSKGYSASELSGLQVTKISLQNGATIFIKSLTQQNVTGPDVVIHGVRTRNDSVIQNDNLSSDLQNVTRFVGLGTLNRAEVRAWKMEKGKTGDLTLSPYINAGESGISGYSSLNNAEALMQLLYSYFSKGTLDQEAFLEYRNLKQQKTSTEFPLEDTIREVINYKTPSRNSSRQGINPPSDVKEIFETYKKQFSNAADFTFVITGSFDKEAMIKLVTRYIGALPGSQKKFDTEKAVLTSFEKRDTNLQVMLVGDSIGDVDVRILVSGMSELTIKNKLELEVVCHLVRQILFYRLREKEKGVYSVETRLRFNRQPNEFFLEIGFLTPPEDVDRLIAAVKNELDRLSRGELKGNIFDNSVSAVRSSVIREMNNSMHWANYLINEARKDSMSSDGVKRLDMLNELTPTDITNLVRDHLNTKEYMLFKLL